ncbi:MAG: carbon-nitrogen hydrolase family protein [Alphaproteobacteria bacterium]|nr:MAG: carbon-nitrogen hydrolase family protein [Alphaproteobacteria bacterium]
MKIALYQARTGIDPEANAEALVAAVEEASAGGAAMLFTPEMSGMLDRDRARAGPNLRREEEDPVLATVREAAARTGIWVHLGSLAVRREDGRLNNRSFVIDDHGEVRATYDKLHLFDVDLPTGESWRESASYAPGERAVVVETPLGSLGLSICYDLRFSELYRALTDAGTRFLAIPAAFTVPTGQALWHVLMRARAIEAGVFVIAAAQGDAGDATGVHLVDIDPAAVDTVRARVPAIDHRRPIPPVEQAR